MRHRFRPAAWFVATAAATGLLACGGDGDDDRGARPAAADGQDPATLAKRAFGPNRAAQSGRVDGKITITLKGARGFSEPVVLAMSGPFHLRPGAALPDYAIDLSFGNQGIRLSSLNGRSFLNLGPTGFAIPASARRRLVRASAKGRNGLTRTLEQFPIAPWRWEINQRVGAIERVGGVRTVRVDTGVNVPVLLRDADAFARVLANLGVGRANGLPPRIPRRARAILADSVRSAKGASWIATSDHVMRKAGLTIDFAIPRARRKELSGVSSAKVVAEVRVTDVGTTPTIDPPERIVPFSALELAFDALADNRGR